VPVRNLTILSLMIIFCLACAIQANKMKYAGKLGHAIQLIEENYVEQVDPQDLFISAMQGVAKELDEYSEFIPAQRYKEFQSTIEQKFGGIGIQIEGPPTAPRLTVVSPIPNTPAFKAGIQAGDTILEIDGVTTEGLSSDDSLKLMRGDVGSPVELLVQRMDSSQRVRVTLVRADIQVSSVYGDSIQPDASWNYFLREDPRIAYIRVALFGERTTEEFKAALDAIRSDAKALVIDLRFNPGGILPAAVDLCDMLINDGVIVRTIGRKSAFDSMLSANPGVDFDVSRPIVILINGDSASASEIMAGCLQDLGRAKIAGSRSYGKGTVQQVFEMGGNQSALKFTTARFHRPSFKNINRSSEMTEQDEWGIRPDEGLELVLTDLQQIYLNRRWQSRGDLRVMGRVERAPEPPFAADPQLQLAVEFLQREYLDGTP
jgi:carboxyl-terminal processing protease